MFILFPVLASGDGTRVNFTTVNGGTAFTLADFGIP